MLAWSGVPAELPPGPEARLTTGGDGGALPGVIVDLIVDGGDPGFTGECPTPPDDLRAVAQVCRPRQLDQTGQRWFGDGGPASLVAFGGVPPGPIIT